MVDGVEEGADDLVVAGGDAAEVLEAADGGFDPPTLAVAAPVVADRDGSVAAAGDDRDGAGFAQAGAEPVGVVGAVGDQSAERTGSRHQVRGGANVGMMAGGQPQDDRPAEQVGDQVELRAATTAGYANGLILRGFFWAPAAERWAFT